MTNAEEMKFQMTKLDQKYKPQTKKIVKENLAFLATSFFIIYEAISILTYIEVNNYLVNGEGQADILKWRTNYKLACGG